MNDQPGAILPHELKRASERLQSILAVEHERVHERNSDIVVFSPEVLKRTRLFVRALRLVEGGRAELLRRAMVLHDLTSRGTEFADALSAAQEALEEWTGRGNRETWQQECLANVATFAPLSPQHIENLLDDVAALAKEVADDSSELRRALTRLEEAATEVVLACEAEQMEACQALLLLGINLTCNGDDAEFLPFIESLPSPAGQHVAESSREICQTPQMPEMMRSAVDSLTAWAIFDRAASEKDDCDGHSESSGHIAAQTSSGAAAAGTSEVADTNGSDKSAGQPKSVPDTPKETQKKSQRHKWDGTALNAAIAFKKHRDDGGLQSLADFIKDYVVEQRIQKPSAATLERKLSYHRDEWDPQRDPKYGRSKAS